MELRGAEYCDVVSYHVYFDAQAWKILQPKNELSGTAECAFDFGEAVRAKFLFVHLGIIDGAAYSAQGIGGMCLKVRLLK